jgi:hypothetical protein
LDWTGLDWIGLDWIGLDWTGLAGMELGTDLERVLDTVLGIRSKL